MARVPDPEEPANFDMTPMIDIVFQLLIFFMLVTDMSKQQNIPLKLPPATKAVKEKLTDDTLLTINVKDDGTITIGGQVYFRPPAGGDWSKYEAKKLEDLFERRRQMKAYQENPGDDTFVKFPVLIRADRSAHFQWVQLILAIATKHGGVTKIQLGAQMPKAGG